MCETSSRMQKHILSLMASYEVHLQFEALDSKGFTVNRFHCFHNISHKPFIYLNIFAHICLVSLLGKSFRQEQCEVRNGPQTDPKGVKTFVEWVPKFAGVLPKDMCKLTCRAKGTGYYVVFSQRVKESQSSQNTYKLTQHTE